MSSAGHDDLTQALIAHRVLASSSPVTARDEELEPEALSGEDEARLKSLMPLYADSDPTTSPAPVTPIKPSFSRRSWTTWAGLSLAAAVVLILTIRSLQGGPAPLGTRYELELQRELAVERGPETDEQVRVYREDRSLEVWLRPVDIVTPPLEVAVYARRPGEVRRLALTYRSMENGVVHIVAPVRDTGLPVGAWELLFVVGRAGELPGADELSGEVNATMLPYDVRVALVRIVAATEQTEPR